MSGPRPSLYERVIDEMTEMLGLALALVGYLFRLALLVPWAIEHLMESDQSSCEK